MQSNVSMNYLFKSYKLQKKKKKKLFKKLNSLIFCFFRLYSAISIANYQMFILKAKVHIVLFYFFNFVNSKYYLIV